MRLKIFQIRFRLPQIDTLSAPKINSHQPSYKTKGGQQWLEHVSG